MDTWPESADGKEVEYKDSGYMTDFNGEKDDLNMELSNSVQKIHTQQDGSCGGQKGDGNFIFVTCEFDDRMVEDEVEHAFSFENKKTHDRIGCDVGVSASEGHQEVFKNDKINEESDVNNFICVGKSNTSFRTLIDRIWKSLCVLPRLICMDGDAALNDGPTSASSEFIQGINSEHRHKILVQRDIQVQSQNEVSSESHTLGTLTVDMGSPAFTVSANMPRQPEISMAHSSGQVALRSLYPVPGREATCTNPSHELMMAVVCEENAEEILCRKQASEKSETRVQSQNEVSSESHTLGTLTVDMGSPTFTVSANMPRQPEISMAHSSGQVALRSLYPVPGREATCTNPSHELMMTVVCEENAEEILCRKQASEKSETRVQSQNEVSSESHTLGTLTVDMGSPTFTVSANMPRQPEISMAHSSGQVALRSLYPVPGREATCTNPSHELMMTVVCEENAEEILCRKQASEKSETRVQSQNEVSSESHTLGTLTVDMGSPTFTVSANMPRQPEISMAHSSGQVALRSLYPVPGREATCTNPSHELMMTVVCEENAEEILCRKQASEKSETRVQSQNEVSSESHTLGSLTMDIGTPAFTVSANMPWQPGITITNSSGQVTLTCLDQVPGREATSASHSQELKMVFLSGENADEKNPAKTSAAVEILCKKQARGKSETIDLQLLIGRETIVLGHSNVLVSDLKQHQQKPDIKSKINQDQNELICKMNWFTSKILGKAYDLGNCKPCIFSIILVYVLALEPRQNDGSNLVTETSLPPTVYHSVDRQVDGQNVLAAAASQTIDGHPSGSSNNSSQEPQREMDERINDPSNSPASDRDIGFTDVHLDSGRVTEEDGDPTHPSAPVHDSDFNISMEPQARSQHSSGDTRCRDEGDDNGFQTDAGRHASDLSQLPVTEQVADGNLFHIAAARSTQNEQPSEVSRIKNTPASPENSHGENGDPGSVKLQATRSTDPGNRSTTEQTYTVRVPARTSNEDDISANAVEMASMNLASGGIRNTKEEASGRGQNENRGDAIRIQETDSAKPKHPQYASRVQRINSFQGWPAGLRQRPEEMAECGFYYAGFDDCVRCFHCGVVLRRWLHEDDPWFEHARWSPSCFYVHKNKGNDFVQSAVKISEMEAASNNITGKDSSNNGQESADVKNKDMNNEAAIEHDPDMNPDIFVEVTRQDQELYDRSICRICLDRKRSVIFLYCGHFGTCTLCSNFLKKCPFCRSSIVEKIITDCW